MGGEIMITVDAIRACRKNAQGWHVLLNGNGVRLGDRVTLGDGVTLGDWVTLGNGVRLGDRVTLGNAVRLGDGATLGDAVRLGDGATSMDLNQQACLAYAQLGSVHKFTKWVRPDRTSPNFDGGTPLRYEVGAKVEVPDVVRSDQQCAPGLHVLLYGHRPEWYGLCEADHDLLALTVEVAAEDILFAGVATMIGKVRVRALTVLE